MDFIFFIQARVGSTRLPNKILKPFYNSTSILEIILNKLKESFPKIKIVICTSANAENDSVRNLSQKLNISCYSGKENNVLKRFIDASELYPANYIIRVCADNPFLEPSYIQPLINIIKNRKELFWDYISFRNGENIPVIKTHLGLFAEIVSLNALKKVMLNTTNPLYLEHVTNFIYSDYSDPSFKIKLLDLPDFLINRKDLRFTIDDIEDFITLQKVYSYYVEVGFDIKKTIKMVDGDKAIKSVMRKNINLYDK